MAAPLTILLRKNSFTWSSEAKEAFSALQHAMAHPPVLKLLEFDKLFTIKCNACGMGVRAIQIQAGKPIAFLSKALKEKSLSLFTDEN